MMTHWLSRVAVLASCATMLHAGLYVLFDIGPVWLVFAEFLLCLAAAFWGLLSVEA